MTIAFNSRTGERCLSWLTQRVELAKEGERFPRCSQRQCNRRRTELKLHIENLPFLKVFALSYKFFPQLFGENLVFGEKTEKVKKIVPWTSKSFPKRLNSAPHTRTESQHLSFSHARKKRERERRCTLQKQNCHPQIPRRRRPPLPPSRLPSPFPPLSLPLPQLCFLFFILIFTCKAQRCVHKRTKTKEEGLAWRLFTWKGKEFSGRRRRPRSWCARCP